MTPKTSAADEHYIPPIALEHTLKIPELPHPWRVLAYGNSASRSTRLAFSGKRLHSELLSRKPLKLLPLAMAIL